MSIHHKKEKSGTLKKLLVSVLVTTIVFSIFVVWLKQDSTCTSCFFAASGLHLSQFKLSLFAVIGAFLIAITYYMSNIVKSLIYVNLTISLFSATVASYLMAVQFRSKCPVNKHCKQFGQKIS